MDSDSTNKYIPDHRRTNFKNKGRFNPEELRRRRENQSVELRKAKRDETLAKRRNFNISTEDSDDEDASKKDDDSSFLNQLQQELPRMIEQIQSNDFDSQLASTVKFRQILSRERNPPIDLVIQSGVVPILVTFMVNQPEMLQLESAWALTNIASGTSEQTKYVVEAGAVPHFVSLLYSSSLEVKEQAIWALGNVAGDSAQYRDYVLSCNAMEPVLSLFNTTKMSLIRTATWTLSNLCRGKNPQPDWNVVSQALPTLAKLIYSVDVETLIDACWAISYLSDGPAEAIQAVVDARIPKRLVELLGHETTLVQTPALRAVGNIVTGNDLQTQIVINAGVLPALLPLLSSPKESIRKEASWTISNITAGNSEQIQAVIDSNLIPPLIRLLENADYKTKKEACWAISNASSGGLTKPDIIRYLVSQGCIKPLCDLLAVADNKIIEVTLDALENILKMGELDKDTRGLAENENAIYIEECGGMEKIYDCQNNENSKIYEKAFQIVDKYFAAEDELDETGLAPEQAGDAFTFNAGEQQNFQF
ncbi:Importin subunit alpha [Wickerhamomyces ciferrii]|uniref:Importin subunit alpha n=1 Tax=Wickerhamomyces ciferrii (strain ATCC 14091 / BCRC 22168 / CBS 111 / JCM 3599 / NBRC 0793 / NRRL Y-1031 F-60-10) TaxID=1206466 RepID=K0KXF3_WICCF|nr:Importin subunit alpha [Wickerhamomyces ciferrii]CCH46717.1 Importin subunit alpha [Wickerhamomyces ciferrii]